MAKRKEQSTFPLVLVVHNGKGKVFLGKNEEGKFYLPTREFPGGKEELFFILSAIYDWCQENAEKDYYVTFPYDIKLVPYLNGTIAVIRVIDKDYSAEMVEYSDEEYLSKTFGYSRELNSSRTGDLIAVVAHHIGIPADKVTRSYAHAAERQINYDMAEAVNNG